MDLPLRLFRREVSTAGDENVLPMGLERESSGEEGPVRIQKQKFKTI